jgi:hypothetical protein
VLCHVCRAGLLTRTPHPEESSIILHNDIRNSPLQFPPFFLMKISI